MIFGLRSGEWASIWRLLGVSVASVMHLKASTDDIRSGPLSLCYVSKCASASSLRLTLFILLASQLINGQLSISHAKSIRALFAFLVFSLVLIQKNYHLISLSFFSSFSSLNRLFTELKTWDHQHTPLTEEVHTQHRRGRSKLIPKKVITLVLSLSLLLRNIKCTKYSLCSAKGSNSSVLSSFTIIFSCQTHLTSQASIYPIGRTINYISNRPK